jgi:uncharacterized protein involved in exopolysaccharide biosynthesis
VNGLPSLLRRAIASAWERRWLFLVPVSALLVPTAFYVVHLPDVYRATATVSVRQVTAERLSGALPTTQDWRAEQILSTARDRVLQADNAKALVGVLWPRGNPEDLYTQNAARGRVQYDQSGDTRFSISIEDPEPARAAAAVNTLVDQFIDNERKAKLRVVEGKRDFLEGEAKKAGDAYDAVLRGISEFRAAHAETMPDLKDSVSADITRLQNEARERENEAQRNRMLVPEVDKLLRSSVPAGADLTRGALSADEQLAQLKLTSTNAALDQAKKDLAALRLRYTDKMDSVKAAALQVDTLEADVTRAKEALDAAKKHAEVDVSARRRADSEGLMQWLRQWRESLLAQEKQAREGADELRRRAEDLSRRLSEMPKTNDEYRKLVEARESAEKTKSNADRAATDARMATEFYRNNDPADTIGFSVENHAVVPYTPSGPARKRYLLTAVALGLLVGYGLHLLRRRYVDEDQVTAPEDLADLVPGALVVSVPLLDDGPIRRRVGVSDILCGAFVAVCLAATVFALGAHQGVIDAPPWFRSWLGTRS